MTLHELSITHTDNEWHEAFLRFVPRVFPQISFRRWHECGGWDERYVARAFADGEELVANASLARMELIVQGEPVRGWQLGAVGTAAEHRGQGLSRRLLEHIIEALPADDLVFLFANETVLDFYPRFGFRRVREQRFGAEVEVAPGAGPLRALDLEDIDDRALLARVARSARPVSERFAARHYDSTVLWYWCNFFAQGLRYAPEADAIFVVERAAETLLVYDVLAAQPIELAAYLPRLIDAPVHRLELGFTPEQLWPQARALGEYTESPLFVRGGHQLPTEAFKFPMLAQT